MPSDTIALPDRAVVLLIGAAGSGKSTFAARHFQADSIVSADRLRGIVGPNESSQQHNDEVFERIHQIVQERAAAGLLTVIDATNTRGPARSELGWHAHRHHRPLVAIVLDLPVKTCLEQNGRRPHPVPPRVVRQQVADLRHIESDLETEGYSLVHLVRSVQGLDQLRVTIGSGTE